MVSNTRAKVQRVQHSVIFVGQGGIFAYILKIMNVPILG